MLIFTYTYLFLANLPALRKPTSDSRTTPSGRYPTPSLQVNGLLALDLHVLYIQNKALTSFTLIIQCGLTCLRQRSGIFSTDGAACSLCKFGAAKPEIDPGAT